MFTHYKHSNLKIPNSYKKKYNLDKKVCMIFSFLYTKTLLLQKLFLKNYKQDLKNKTVT